ncbi:MAG: tripartite tricarboxylate transporter substrate binding protein [Verrucomicrobiales bacterium]|nr:tripartite tricarboxylate transporter substrate binding protein [Verrucomicrobiales bacterium]
MFRAFYFKPFRFLFSWLSVAYLACQPSAVDAAPSAKPVQVIVPFSAGGGSDTLARFLVREINASGLDDSPWVVINIPGAGGTIGSRHAKNAFPNGNTVLFLHDGILTAKLSGKAPYGPEVFEPIAMTGKVGMVLAVSENSLFSSLPELLEAASTTPDTITFAANLGAPSFYVGKLIESRSPSSKFRYVQSGGGARRFADIKGNHIQVTVFSVSEFLSFRDGGLRGLAYFGEDRHPGIPEVPTARENGIDVVYENLQGWWAPLRTPGEQVDRLEKVLEAAFRSPPVQKALEEQSIETVYLPAKQFAREIEEKNDHLQQIPFRVDVRPPPRLEWLLLPLLAFLLLILARRTKFDKPDDRTATASVPLKRAMIVTFALAFYLIVLSSTDGLFFLASSIFLFALLIRSPFSVGKSVRALIPSLAIPFLLVLFIEKLLGLPLP